VEEYAFKTKPFGHQLDLFHKTWNQEGFCVHWEQGCGKSKPVIDTAARLYLGGLIDAAVIVAPNGVHSNWRDNELPAHLPDRVSGVSRAHVWDAKTAKSKSAKADFMGALAHPGLAWLMMGYGAMSSKQGVADLETFLKGRRCLMTLDESARIKNPKAERTKILMRMRTLPKYRRTLTGTPISNNPFDLYAQIEWAFPGFWKNNGFNSYTSFRKYFGVWELKKDSQGHSYEVLRECVHLDLLSRIIKPVTSRVIKSDVLDLPPKLYRTVSYNMSPEQKRLYRALKTDFVALISDNDPEKGAVSAEMAIQRLLRMQQVVLGYVRLDGEDEITDLKENPRLDLLRDMVEDLNGDQCIIWGRYRRDVDKIMNLFGDIAVRADGSTPMSARVEAVAAIQAGRKQLLVATPAAMGEGWTITAARHTIYYSNSYRLTDRLQSEDRNHRIGQKNPVDYTDIIARGSNDRDVLRALRSKKNIADIVLGDNMLKWFEEESYE
jgi:SNF2 family DNA or RNA helicase